MHIHHHPSQNFGERADGARVELVVLHFTGMPDFEEARDRLCDAEAEVSCHYLVSRTGEIFDMVPDDRRAWHAGEGSWGGRGDVNSRSIGIEIDNDGASPFTGSAIDALIPLIEDILHRHHLGNEAVIGHQDMAPGRKADPGPFFPWRKLAEADVAVWPDAPHAIALKGTPADRSHWNQFVEAARVFGYPVDGEAEALHRAFRHRFRGDDGIFDPMDTALMMDLARRFPAARS